MLHGGKRGDCSGRNDALALHYAAARGCCKCIRRLLSLIPRQFSANDCMSDNVTPVYLAAQEGHLAVLRCLVLQHNGSLVHLTSDGMAPIHAAAQMARTNCLQWMVEEMGVDINMHDEDGATPLHFAASRGHSAVVRWLLNRGAEITHDSFGKSPIDDAAENGHMKCVSLLVRRKNGHSKTSTTNTDDSASNYSREVSPAAITQTVEDLNGSSSRSGDAVGSDVSDVWSNSSSMAWTPAATTRLAAASVHLSAEDIQASDIDCNGTDDIPEPIEFRNQHKAKNDSEPVVDSGNSSTDSETGSQKGFYLHQTHVDSDCRLRLLFDRHRSSNQVEDSTGCQDDSIKCGLQHNLAGDPEERSVQKSLTSSSSVKIQKDSNDTISQGESREIEDHKLIENFVEKTSRLGEAHRLDEGSSASLNQTNSNSKEIVSSMHASINQEEAESEPMPIESMEGNSSAGMDSNVVQSEEAAVIDRPRNSVESSKLKDCLREFASIEDSIPPPPGFDDNVSRTYGMESTSQPTQSNKLSNDNRQTSVNGTKNGLSQLSTSFIESDFKSRHEPIEPNVSSNVENTATEEGSKMKLVQDGEDDELQPPLPPKIASVQSSKGNGKRGFGTQAVEFETQSPSISSSSNTTVDFCDSDMDRSSRHLSKQSQELSSFNDSLNKSEVQSTSSQNLETAISLLKNSADSLTQEFANPKERINSQVDGDEERCGDISAEKRFVPPPPPALPPQLFEKNDRIWTMIKKNQLNSGLVDRTDETQQLPRFIPPTFQTPADSETLIKPSEYLKSLNKTQASTSKITTTGADNICVKTNQSEVDFHNGSLTENAEEGDDDAKRGDNKSITNDRIADCIAREKESCSIKKEIQSSHSSDGSSRNSTSQDLTDLPVNEAGGTTSQQSSSSLSKSDSGPAKAQHMNDDAESVHQYLEKVPVNDPAGTPIPQWKRMILARKAAERAINESAIASRAAQMQQLPAWKQQLLQRRQTDRSGVANIACT